MRNFEKSIETPYPLFYFSLKNSHAVGAGEAEANGIAEFRTPTYEDCRLILGDVWTDSKD